MFVDEARKTGYLDWEYWDYGVDEEKRVVNAAADLLQRHKKLPFGYNGEEVTYERSDFWNWQTRALGAEAEVRDKLIAQADGMPANWLRPTTTWREGEVIIDEHTLTLPPELPEDTYDLYVGLYEPDGQRLPVVAQGQLLPNERLPLEASNGMDW